MARTLVWYRNDLRIHDHEPLLRAVETGEVLPLFCFDPRQFGRTSFGFPKTGFFRTKFLIESVSKLRDRFRSLGGDLIIRVGKPEQVIPELLNTLKIDRVLTHKEVTSEETSVEDSLKEELGERIHFYWGSTLFHIEDINFTKESLPNGFTSFRKKIEKYSSVRELMEEPKHIRLIEDVEAGSIPSPGTLSITKKEVSTKSVLLFNGGEDEALSRLSEYIWDKDLLRKYKYTRNGLLGGDYSSKFSPWLANGTLSPRKIYWEVKKYEKERVQNESTYWLIFELIWRDYFRFSAWKHGNQIFKKGGIQKKERNQEQNMECFNTWAKAQTGIPFIDANIRELNETGFMSNRGRQNVASFLAQNLNIDWRMGAEYFESMLLDYDPCSNYGNWAYNATVGHDPRNRYFNILLQAEKYDKKGEYIRYWIPELKFVPNEFIHCPHTIPLEQQKLYELEIGIDYPKPMIDLEHSYEKIKARA